MNPLDLEEKTIQRDSRIQELENEIKELSDELDWWTHRTIMGKRRILFDKEYTMVKRIIRAEKDKLWNQIEDEQDLFNYWYNFVYLQNS